MLIANEKTMQFHSLYIKLELNLYEIQMDTEDENY